MISYEGDQVLEILTKQAERGELDVKTMDELGDYIVDGLTYGSGDFLDVVPPEAWCRRYGVDWYNLQNYPEKMEIWGRKILKEILSDLGPILDMAIENQNTRNENLTKANLKKMIKECFEEVLKEVK